MPPGNFGHCMVVWAPSPSLGSPSSTPLPPLCSLQSGQPGDSLPLQLQRVKGRVLDCRAGQT